MQLSKFLKLTLKFHHLNEEVNCVYVPFYKCESNPFSCTEITTVEGIMSRCISSLEQDQPVRKVLDPEGAAQIDAFIQILIEKRNLKSSFTIVS